MTLASHGEASSTPWLENFFKEPAKTARKVYFNRNQDPLLVVFEELEGLLSTIISTMPGGYESLTNGKSGRCNPSAHTDLGL